MHIYSDHLLVLAHYLSFLQFEVEPKIMPGLAIAQVALGPIGDGPRPFERPVYKFVGRLPSSC